MVATKNFFLPSTKLKEKVREGARIIKKHEAPKTAYQRVMEDQFVSERRKEELRERRNRLNPFKLADGLETKLQEFHELKKKLQKGRLSNENNSKQLSAIY